MTEELRPIEREEDSTRKNDWILDNHELFEGNYGHPLFGNFSVTFNETRGQLMFTQGRVGEGPLLPIDVEEPEEQKHFFIAFEGVLYNYLRTTGGRYLPVHFDNLNGVYQELVAEGFEPEAPPVFLRGLDWNAEY